MVSGAPAPLPFAPPRRRRNGVASMSRGRRIAGASAAKLRQRLNNLNIRGSR
jgi:hypothetical protein